MTPLVAALALSLLARTVRGAVHEDVKGACKEIGDVIPVLYSGTAYKAEMQDYWSYACVEARPYCIVQPRSAEQVSTAVKILNKYPQAVFAVKSGGHDPNVGHASIPDGVLLALGKMKGATYDRARDVAYVKPGGKWANVIGDLAPHGVAVVGGRLCESCYSSDAFLALTSISCSWSWRTCPEWWTFFSECPTWSCSRQHSRTGDSLSQWNDWEYQCCQSSYTITCNERQQYTVW